MAEQEDDDAAAEVTLVEVHDRQLEEEEAAEAEAEAWGDQYHCTHEQGAVTQSVFACMTCSKALRKPVGVCLACSLRCHLDHDVRELWTKHVFVCDCGTGCMAACAFATTGERGFVAESNRYGHNFEGRFCWCDKEYDAQAESDVMVQCIACEDWFHAQCIAAHGTPSDLLIHEATDTSDEGESGVHNADFLCCACADASMSVLMHYPQCVVGHTEPFVAPSSCPRNTTTLPLAAEKGHCLVLRNGWKKALCRCDACSKMYMQSNWSWIFTESTDDWKEEAVPPPPPSAPTVAAASEARMTKTEQLGTQALLSSVNRVIATELITGFDQFKTSLAEWLRAKSAEMEQRGVKRAITSEDIREFRAEFEQKQSKRRK